MMAPEVIAELEALVHPLLELVEAPQRCNDSPRKLVDILQVWAASCSTTTVAKFERLYQLHSPMVPLGADFERQVLWRGRLGGSLALHFWNPVTCNILSSMDVHNHVMSAASVILTGNLIHDEFYDLRPEKVVGAWLDTAPCAVGVPRSRSLGPGEVYTLAQPDFHCARATAPRTCTLFVAEPAVTCANAHVDRETGTVRLHLPRRFVVDVNNLRKSYRGATDLNWPIAAETLLSIVSGVPTSEDARDLVFLP